MSGLAWFRMYAEFATDPKVQSMSETLQRRFVMLMCFQCSGELEQLSDEELATALRVTPEELAETKRLFQSKRFLDSGGKIRSWNKRQFKSDTSTPRVKKHREEKKKQRRNVSATPSETESDTDSEGEKNPTAATRPTRKAVPRESADGWLLDFKLAYPHRAGDQGWRKATKAAHARFAEGHTPAELIAGAQRYAAFCDAAGKTGTEYVKQAATFLGPEKHFLLPWHAPPKPETAIERIARLNGGNGHGRRDERTIIEHEPGAGSVAASGGPVRR